MSNTKEGGQTLVATMIAKYGSREKWLEHCREIGRKGGKQGHTGGFFADRNRASIAGKKGGKISKRGPHAS
jgi:uncharacterized protein